MSRERILATTDLGENSYKVLDKAIDFALTHDKWLEVLHVAAPSLFAFGFATEKREVKPDDPRLIAISEKIKNGLGRKMERLNVETCLGDIVDTIKAYAQEKRAGLVIIGASEHKGGIVELVLGSTARQIISESTVSVLVSKSDGHKADYRTIYVPTDFSDRSQNTVGTLLEFFPKAKLIIEHLVEMPSEVQLAFYDLDDDYIKNFTDNATAKAKEAMTLFMSGIKNRFDRAQNADIVTSFISGHIDGVKIRDRVAENKADLVGLYAETSRYSRTLDIIQKSNCDLFLSK
ncbi:hypothetical protein AGMMS49521_4130 [Campylobacterota bacterium]|nr:hypothetical protein AGMMS49521_4130 [Campylobacterota bacterium]GHV02925.1 hypothetical protein AGMMS50229_00640 [Campylobacterota bacterium]